jgi:putative flippase GtrA
MKAVARIAFLYSVFAVIATAANLATQAFVIWVYTGAYAIELSILAGTAAGLPIKYILEKRHIFEFESESLKHDGKLFFMYSFLGIFTTALFWGTEFAFQWIFGTDLMRYLGGAIGLAMGYIIKYQLDKRFVFVHQKATRIEVF